MQPQSLTLKDRPLFDKYLGLGYRALSVYSFANIYIWKGLFRIFWQVIEDNLCVFFKDKIGCFMYLSPLGKHKSGGLIKKCFEIMDENNSDPVISRIENIEDRDRKFYSCLGFNCVYKSSDYVCLREDIAAFKGDRFKSQRAAYNQFIKNNDYKYRPYSQQDKQACLKLYEKWMEERKSASSDSVYQGMLKDSLICQKPALRNYSRLNIFGRVVEVKGKVSAYTLGYGLNKDTFCVLFETTDLKLKGLSCFIFRKFCAGQSGYKYVNIMDDLGLENLKQVKLSYRPVKKIPAYIVQRQ